MNTFIREPVDGGDIGVWATKELNQNRLAVGVNSCILYDDSGILKLSVGKIGFNNSSIIGVFDMDTIVTISIAGVTNSNWAKIELALSGTTPVLTSTNISGAIDPGVIPAEYTESYDPEKGGYYIDSSKRCIGIAWKNASGVLEGIINSGSIISSYYGYSTTNDANDYIYRWDFNINNTRDIREIGMHISIPLANRPPATLNGGASATWTLVDFSPYVPTGVKSLCLHTILILVGDNATDSVVGHIRPYGSSESASDKTRVNTVLRTNLPTSVSLYSVNTLMVECDNTGLVEYQISTVGTGSLFLYIRGFSL